MVYLNVLLKYTYRLITALQKVNISRKVCTVVIDGLELEYLLTCQKQKEGQKLKQDILGKALLNSVGAKNLIIMSALAGRHHVIISIFQYQVWPIILHSHGVIQSLIPKMLHLLNDILLMIIITILFCIINIIDGHDDIPKVMSYGHLYTKITIKR